MQMPERSVCHLCQDDDLQAILDEMSAFRKYE